LYDSVDRFYLDFLITLLDYEFKGLDYDSVLLLVLAVIGVWEDGGWYILD